MVYLMGAQDRKWDAEANARILADAEKIKSDSKKMQAARAAAKRMAVEDRKRLEGLEKIAKTPRKRQSKNPRKRQSKNPRKLTY